MVKRLSSVLTTIVSLSLFHAIIGFFTRVVL